MTTKKPTKKTVAKKTAKKAVAKKAPAKKAAPKKAAPKKKTFNVSSTTETNIIKPGTNNSGTVVYAADIKNLSLRDRVYNWFRK